MILLDEGKIIEHITDELFSYISKLEETKCTFIKEYNNYLELKTLYENINYDISKFIVNYCKSNSNKRKYFESIVNEIYNSNNKKILYEEINNANLMCIYNPNSKLQLKQFNDFINKLSLKINSYELMLDKKNLNSLEEKIQKLVDFSNIFYKNTFIDYCDTDTYINIINLINLSEEEKIQAIEIGIKEFSRFYQEKENYELVEYNELEDTSIKIDNTEDIVYAIRLDQYEVLNEG